MNPTNTKSVKVKAKWAPYDIFGISSMQEMSSTICANTTTPIASASVIVTYSTADNTKIPQTSLVDLRDNKSYTVRKLPDGKCWMIDTLKFGSSNSITLDSSTSDIRDGTFFTLQAPAEWSVIDNSTDHYIIPNSSTSMRDNNKGPYLDEYGYYYNFYAATAGSSNVIQAGENAPYSICPKNWTLPSKNDLISISDGLYNSYSKLSAVPFNAILNGLWYIANRTYGMNDLNNKGLIFSSTKDYSHNEKNIYFWYLIVRGQNMESYDVQSNYTESISIRCIAR